MAKEIEETKEEEIPNSELVDLKKELEKLKNDRDMLMATVDKKALATYYMRNKDKAPSVVRVRTMNEKVIVGWKTVEDKGSYKIAGTGNWTEKQVIELMYEDKKTQKMDYMDFVRRYGTIKAKVKSTTEDEVTGAMVFKVIREDNGQELIIGSTYVN